MPLNVVSSNIDQTLNEFLSRYDYSITVQTILDTKDPITNITNWEKIKRKYSKKELTDNEGKYPTGQVLIKAGTPLDLRNTYIKRNLPKKVQGETFQLTEYKPFIAKQLADLLKDPKYIRSIDSVDGERVVTIDNNDITVYIWCRALTYPNDNSQSGSWINVSAFIQNITTQTTKDVGGFSFSLAPIACEYSPFFGWKVSSDVVGYDTGNIRDDVFSSTSILKYDPKKKNGYFREKFYFNTILQENDLVYIKFEKLSLEQELEVFSHQTGGQVSPTDVPNRIWDMIGLVDNVSLNTSPNNVNVNVSGRDLMKILIEDGSTFFVSQFAQNIFSDEDSVLAKRNRFDKILQSVAAASYTFKPIHTILKFIFNKYSNIGIVSNNAFIGYGNGASKSKYQLASSSLKKKSRNLNTLLRNTTSDINEELNSFLLNEDKQGVWRICDLVFDEKVSKRILADNNISEDNGSIINSIHKICQEPFVEFYGDTYKDKYYFIVRKPPFDTNGYRGLVYENFTSEENKDVNSNSILQNNTLKISDDKLKNLGDRVIKQAGISKQNELSDLVIDIDDVDVLGEPQLDYHNEAYSWYRLVPTGLGILSEDVQFYFAPAIPFDEYAEVWGNKAYQLEYNYCPTEYLKDSQEKAEAKFAEKQVFLDLQYVIQSNQYLPFTRRGSIVLTGNRTIKRGLFINFKPTKEVFYVDSVAHARSMGARGQNERTTVLQVSRGMREPYIKGKLVNFVDGPKLVSYFNIINLNLANDANINNQEFLKDWKVDKNIFNFFLQRRQWVD